MKEKKTEVIAVRLSEKVKSIICNEAEKREWTASHMAEKILSEWAAAQICDDLHTDQDI